MIESQGIILKTFFHKNKTITLLDPTYGKIMCIADKEDVCVGGLMKYQLRKSSYSYVAHAMEYIALPCNLTKDDLLFYHCVLEICYYFIPLEMLFCDVFYHIQHLALLDKHGFSYQYKIVFLTRLILLIGIQPEITPHQYPLLTKLSCLSVKRCKKLYVWSV